MASQLKKTIYQKIWDGEIPSYPLYRNDSAAVGLMAILDVFPATPGHTLVVPTEPVESWDKLPPHRELQATLLGQFLRPHLLECLSPQPIRVPKLNIGSQVPHVHDQYIPMYEQGDTNRLWDPRRMEAQAPASELEIVHAQIVFPNHLIEHANAALTELAENLS